MKFTSQEGVYKTKRFGSCTTTIFSGEVKMVKELLVTVHSDVKASLFVASASPCFFGAAMALCPPTQYTLLVLSNTINSAIVSIVQTYCNI